MAQADFFTGNPHIDAVPGSTSAPASNANSLDFFSYLSGGLESLSNFASSGLQSVQNAIGAYHNFDANIATTEAQATARKSQAQQSAAAIQSGRVNALGGFDTSTLLVVGALGLGAYLVLRK